MASRIEWNNGFGQSIKAEMTRRTTAASIRLTSAVKANISQPGTLRYTARTKKGKPSKSQKTIYNFTHSKPGNPPFKQKGDLRRRITYEVVAGKQIVGRVGTNYLVALYLEQGTKRMKPRPFLVFTLWQQQPALKLILTRQIPPGGLAAIRSMQTRSAVFGRGARGAGFA